eukprot:2622686-Lingulodinium_polyedra.AAC.1
MESTAGSKAGSRVGSVVGSTRSLRWIVQGCPRGYTAGCIVDMRRFCNILYNGVYNGLYRRARCA